jgi:hypothetical protein
MQDFGGAPGNDPGDLRGGRRGGEDDAPDGGDPGPGASPLGLGQLLLAETLGLAMARRAADILERHRDAVTRAALADDPGAGEAAATADAAPPSLDIRQFALDDAVFTAVLDATNDCLARFDSRPPADRWCDALLHLLDLARYGMDPR